jgi:GntR family transcriptional regulator
VDIKVLDTSHGPIYEQIRAQIAAMIQAGSLSSGAQLPSPGTLAQQLTIDKGEIARAYFELEQQGLVAARRSKNFLGETTTDYRVV